MALKRLHPAVSENGISHVAFISEMTAVSTGILGNVVDNATDERTEIIAAVDLLTTGF